MRIILVEERRKLKREERTASLVRSVLISIMREERRQFSTIWDKESNYRKHYLTAKIINEKSSLILINKI